MRKVAGFALTLILACLSIVEDTRAETLSIRWSQAPAESSHSYYEASLGRTSGQYTKKIRVNIPRLELPHVTALVPIYLRISSIDSNGNTLSFSSEYTIVVPQRAGVQTLDSDGDGISDSLDNCPLISNYDQSDTSGNGIGDLCDDGSILPNPTPTIIPSATPTPFPTPTTTPTPVPSILPSLSPSPSPSQTPSPSPTPIAVLPFPEEELIEGFDPEDKGSKVQKLKNQFCNEWNGFFSMYNFAELRNQSRESLTVLVEMYDMSSRKLSTSPFMLQAGMQRDIPLHELGGFARDQYGRVCFSYGGDHGLLGGQVSYYLQGDGSDSFQFAYSSSFTNGKRGEVFVPLNTYNPNLELSKQANPVANWIQITNLNQTTARGRLFFHDQSGALIGERNGIMVSLEAGQRKDISGHNFGRMVGLARWVPEEEDSVFLVRTVRYIYDNPYFHNSFDTAFQINGMNGTGNLISAPLDTTQGSAIIEIINTLPEASRALIEIRDEAGRLKKLIHLNEGQLPAYGSFHIITDDFLGRGERGSAFIRGNKRNSIAAVTMMYARNKNAELEFMYGVNAELAHRTALKGSYNTFLSQTPILVLSNPNDTAARISLKLTRFSGETSGLGGIQQIPANGSLYLDLSGYELRDVYGLINIESNTALTGWVIREKNQNYGIPTRLE